mgnify:FL=1|uniref:Uncharacterized protein n=1 Tax=Ammonifex degensii TaxID=42838 RepID=A0A7C2E1P8_9THEO
MAERIHIQVELGLKGVEKRDVFVYLDEKLAASYFDLPYEQIPVIAGEFRQKFPDAQLEVWCRGEDCCGKAHHWRLPI